MTAPGLELRTLGAAFARGPDGAGLNGLGAKGLGALVYLALSPGQAATRDVLVDLLWGRGAPEQGRASLRQELRRMKRALGDLFDACLETPGGQIALRPGAVRCDYLDVEQACQARDTAGLSALLERYGGPFLAPLSVNEIAFQDWTAERNSHIETVALEGLLRLMLLDESAGRLDRAAQAARALLGIDPLQEDVHAALVRLHVSAGRISQARRHVESARTLFLDELGEPPETDLAALIPTAASHPRADPAASRAPSNDAPGAPARPADPSDRPLVALEIAPAEAGAPDDPSLLGSLRASVLEQFGALSFLRIQDAAALCALGADLLLDRADYAAIVALEAPAPGEAAAARLSFARRGDGALSAHRRLAWPEASEVAPAAGLGPALAGALASALLEAETERAAPGEADDGPWPRLMAARRAALGHALGPLDAARGALEADARLAASDPATLCLLAQTHLREAWLGLTPGPRDAAFRGRETALRAVRRAPTSPWAHHLYGLGMALMQDLAVARRHQMRALELAPAFPAALGETARLLALSGDVEEAAAWAARALALAPGAPEAPRWARAEALARFAAGDAVGALAALPPTSFEAGTPPSPDGAAGGDGGARPAERAGADPADAPAIALDPAGDALLRAACLLELRRPAEAEAALPSALAARLSPEAAVLSHPFADAARLDALLAPLGG